MRLDESEGIRARLQGVPDFPPVGTTIQQLWGFADAVCVPAIRWIDEHVLTPMAESSRVEMSGCGS